MIPNEEKEGWHYLAVKKLSELLRGITSKHQDDFCSSNCLQSFATKTNLNLKYVKKKDFLWNCFTNRKNNVLEFNQYMTSDKLPYIIYTDIESLIIKNK